jgi:hypothetical protein
VDETLETILDQLMAAEQIGGSFLGAGPFDLAVAALRNAGLTKRQDARRALGYPVVLCRALEGACQVLTNIDDRRTIAVSVFTEVPPRTRPPNLRTLDLVGAALWCVRQVEAWTQDYQSLTAEVPPLLERCLHGRALPVTKVGQISDELSRAMTGVQGDQAFHPKRLTLAVSYFALHAARRADQDQPPGEVVEHVCRDVGRLAALNEGAAGAVNYCVGLARQLGM